MTVRLAVGETVIGSKALSRIQIRSLRHLALSQSVTNSRIWLACRRVYVLMSDRCPGTMPDHDLLGSEKSRQASYETIRTAADMSRCGRSGQMPAVRLSHSPPTRTKKTTIVSTTCDIHSALRTAYDKNTAPLRVQEEPSIRVAAPSKVSPLMAD